MIRIVFSGWERLVPRANSAMGILPVPRSLALLQGFDDSLFLFKGKAKEGLCEDLLLYKTSKLRDKIYT